MMVVVVVVVVMVVVFVFVVVLCWTKALPLSSPHSLPNLVLSWNWVRIEDDGKGQFIQRMT